MSSSSAPSEASPAQGLTDSHYCSKYLWLVGWIGPAVLADHEPFCRLGVFQMAFANLVSGARIRQTKRRYGSLDYPASG